MHSLEQNVRDLRAIGGPKGIDQVDRVVHIIWFGINRLQRLSRRLLQLMAASPLGLAGAAELWSEPVRSLLAEPQSSNRPVRALQPEGAIIEKAEDAFDVFDFEAVARKNPASAEGLREIPELRRWQVEVLGAGFIAALRKA